MISLQQRGDTPRAVYEIREYLQSRMNDEDKSSGKHVTSKTPASDDCIGRADNLSLATTSTIHRCTPYSVMVLLSI